ncbi:MAG: glycosyltransferase [Thermoplasmata archaeon]|nr:glycosyltransferase [Thermoplasmata archaeon]
MRILHVRNVANVGKNLALYQRAKGYDARVFDFIGGNELDYSLGLDTKIIPEYRKLEGVARSPMDNLRYGVSLIKYVVKNGLYKFDVFHFHGGRGFLEMSQDLPFIKAISEKMVMHYHGSTLRVRGRFYWNKICDREIVSTPDLLKFAPGAVWIPNLITEHGLLKKERNDGMVRIGHAPTNRALKGTECILKVIKNIQRKRRDVEFDLIESVPHKEALERYSKCDILIDTVFVENPQQCVWPGVLSIECAAMGLPVCTYIDEELEARFLPKKHGFTSVSRDNLEQALEALIDDPDMRDEMGRRANKVILPIYNNERNAKKILKIYKF